MISIIVSSYNKNNFEAFSKNVDKTIGVPYEIIDIRNPGLMGICKAYNLGAEQANYENLLFCHEDILFHTENWGKLFVQHLSLPDVGVIGIAGSNYVCKAPTGWHLSDDKYNFINIIQHDNNIINIHHIDKVQQVFSLDGVWLGMTKEKFNELKFNESIKGFHAYDLDFSLRSSQKYNNYVINDILIEHFSIGNPDEIWFKNIIEVRSNIKLKYTFTKDANLEENEFINFFTKFFNYNELTLFNLFKTLKFVPLIRSKKIFRLYYKHVKYKSYYKNYIYNKK